MVTLDLGIPLYEVWVPCLTIRRMDILSFSYVYMIFFQKIKINSFCFIAISITASNCGDSTTSWLLLCVEFEKRFILHCGRVACYAFPLQRSRLIRTRHSSSKKHNLPWQSISEISLGMRDLFSQKSEQAMDSFTFV